MSILALLWGGSQAALGLSGRISLRRPMASSSNSPSRQRAPESLLSTVNHPLVNTHGLPFNDCARSSAEVLALALQLLDAQVSLLRVLRWITGLG